MGVTARLHHYSFEEYLALEEVSTVRHEFLDGEIYAMAGGSIAHAALSVAVSSALQSRLAGRCRIFSSDLRVRCAATGLACYPDVSVVCGELATDPASRDTVINPTVVVEVLSPATMDYDLGEKFSHYEQTPSLKAVVYLWQDRRRIEVRARVEGAWRTEVVTEGAVFRIDALGITLAVDQLYTAAGV